MVAWDTLSVAVSDNEDAKRQAGESGVMSSLVKCMKGNLSEPSLLKCLICVSDLVHESSLCQQQMLSCDGVPCVIQLMAKTQVWLLLT